MNVNHNKGHYTGWLYTSRYWWNVYCGKYDNWI